METEEEEEEERKNLTRRRETREKEKRTGRIRENWERTEALELESWAVCAN